jgi:hypothetical protein
LPGLAGLSAGGNILARAVSFPPRNESLDFGLQLNNLYRDTLRRETVSTFVDLEGWIVWTQEYLRYRVNNCAPAEAISRVFSQIRGGGVSAVCAGAATGQVSVPFPTRDQSLDFGMQLNEFYRDSLNRMAAPTYVDLEGWVVWIHEYFRYRVSGCDHSDAVTSVFTQVTGGSEPTCDSSAVGYWDY